MNDIKHELSTLIKTFNDKRVISQEEIQTVLKAFITILAENKKGVESLNTETKQQVKETLAYIEGEHKDLLNTIKGDLKASKSEIEQATKAQNERAFKRLQTLISAIKMPKDGKDGENGKDGSPGRDGLNALPANADEIRDKLETLTGNERLDASAIKGLPDYIKTIKRKGKDMLVGGIRFFENLADVSVPQTYKRQDLIAQYNTTNNRWENGIALTVSATEPTDPRINDLWVDIS